MGAADAVLAWEYFRRSPEYRAVWEGASREVGTPRPSGTRTRTIARPAAVDCRTLHSGQYSRLTRGGAGSKQAPNDTSDRTPRRPWH